MGESVLTPEESLLGKVTRSGPMKEVMLIRQLVDVIFFGSSRRDDGGKGIRRTFRTLVVGK